MKLPVKRLKCVYKCGHVYYKQRQIINVVVKFTFFTFVRFKWWSTGQFIWHSLVSCLVRLLLLSLLFQDIHNYYLIEDLYNSLFRFPFCFIHHVTVHIPSADIPLTQRHTDTQTSTCVLHVLFDPYDQRRSLLLIYRPQFSSTRRKGPDRKTWKT